MRNRDLITRKLEQIDSNLTGIEFQIKRQGLVEDLFLLTKKSKELVEQLLSTISQEPLSPNEYNGQ